MFIESLKITSVDGVIRNIQFHNGLNLIVDNTPISDSKTKTGNNVGKTTVLKLVDVCFGAKPNIIYQDTEKKKNEYALVKEFLEKKEVSATLNVIDNFFSKKTTVIEKNFLKNKKAVRRINGEDVLDKDFERKLLNIFFPNQKYEKPTFRQIVSHNNRYTEFKISNTLKTLDSFSKDIEYENLYLFLLGCDFAYGAKKQHLAEKKAQEVSYRKRMENGKSKAVYTKLLKQIDIDIQQLSEQKAFLGLSTDFESDLAELDDVKYHINKVRSEISALTIRKNLIESTIEDLQNSRSEIDFVQLRQLYDEVKIHLKQVQKTFEDLVAYHNKMIIEKVRFISAELPDLNNRLKIKHDELSDLLKKEELLAKKVAKYDSFDMLEDIIEQLNEKYHQKGEFETIIRQIESVEQNIKSIEEELKTINEGLFSDKFENELNKRVERFNKIYSLISNELYGEQYILTCEKVSRNGKEIYDFNSFNTNMSTGKKQGEILCFDLAYILYARQENIPCFEFLLNDKKELLHGNQLEKVSEFVNKNNIQLIIPILKDKLPVSLITKENIVLELSQEDKLFRIEKSSV